MQRDLWAYEAMCQRAGLELQSWLRTYPETFAARP
jgi:hypothetical protein